MSGHFGFAATTKPSREITGSWSQYKSGQIIAMLFGKMSEFCFVIREAVTAQKNENKNENAFKNVSDWSKKVQYYNE